MSDVNPTQMRVELARGHWALEEYEEAVACLERCKVEGPERTLVRELAESFRQDLAGQHNELLKRRLEEHIAAWEDPPPDAQPAQLELGAPLATPTLAALLAAQGHTERALAVAENALRLRPDDDRARALAEDLRASAGGRGTPAASSEEAAAQSAPGEAVAADPAPAHREAAFAELGRWLMNARRRIAELEGS